MRVAYNLTDTNKVRFVFIDLFRSYNIRLQEIYSMSLPLSLLSDTMFLPPLFYRNQQNKATTVMMMTKNIQVKFRPPPYESFATNQTFR